VSLAPLLLPPEARADHVVARDGARTLRLEALLQDAAVVARALPDAAPGSEVTFAFGHDRAAFAAALLATWARGLVAVLPENPSREHVAPRLARPAHVAFLHDTGVGRGVFVPERLRTAPRPPALDLAVDAPERRPALLAFRALPSGEEVSVAWTLGALRAHLEAWDPAAVPERGTTLVSALTPTCLPDVLGALLVPLRAGAAFAMRTPPDAAGLRAVLAAGVETLLTTPFPARALAAQPAGALGRLATVLVADAPLGAHAARLLAERHRARVVSLREAALADAPEALAAELEALLGAEPELADVAVLACPEGLRVAAVGGPEAAARARALVEPFGPAELRVLARLPRDANGRLDAARLHLAFGRGRDGRPVTRALAWSEDPPSADGARRFRTRLPERWLLFEGHFPPEPLLAGAAQLTELVLPCARRLAPDLGPVRGLGGVKFLGRLAPGDAVEVELRAPSRAPDGGCAIAFEIRSGDRRCAAGRLELGPEPAS